MGNNYVTKKEFDATINGLTSGMNDLKAMMEQLLIQNTDSAPSKTVKKSVAKKSTPKKSEEKKTQTREERLTEKYGDIESRKAFVELKNKYAEEFKSLGEATKKYIPKKKFGEVIRMGAKSGKFTKKYAFELHCEYAK